MSFVDLIPEELTKENFARFGDVLEVEGAERILINEGTTERFHALTTLDVADENGTAIVFDISRERAANANQNCDDGAPSFGQPGVFPLE